LETSRRWDQPGEKARQRPRSVKARPLVVTPDGQHRASRREPLNLRGRTHSGQLCLLHRLLDAGEATTGMSP